MPHLRIGINALYLIPGGVGGTEVYLRSLLRALEGIDRQHEYFVFTNLETGADLIPESSRFFLEPQNVHAANRPARLLWEQYVLPREIHRLQLDCLLNPGFTAPLSTSCPNVTVFHDLQHKRHPEHFRWWELPFWRFFLFTSATRSGHLIAVSEATRQDLLKFYGLPADRITVIPHGVDDRFFSLSRSPEEAQPYLLCVSTLHPHKNIERLVRVFARFRERRPDFRLVLAGMKGFRGEAIRSLIKELRLSCHVELTGWIPEKRLHDLYRRASAFVYPSTFEGFGMPVLEAMAAGIPLACSHIEPLRSLAQDAAITFDPQDDGAMLEALQLVTTPSAARDRNVLAGRERASRFTWEACAERTLAVLREQAARRPASESAVPTKREAVR